MKVFSFIVIMALTACTDHVTSAQMATATKFCAQYGGLKQVDIGGVYTRTGLMNVTCNNGVNWTTDRSKP
ncbi:MAG TPA: hypothetical protein VFW00_08985 [Rhodocyclaceae bacterium]|nr:hypothetical protein [Rhodocyclaceae bacterium]